VLCLVGVWEPNVRGAGFKLNRHIFMKDCLDGTVAAFFVCSNFSTGFNLLLVFIEETMALFQIYP